METVSVRVVIEGRVQGVGYRWWTLEQAKERGLIGWVRNRMDNSVEALFSGPPENVKAMIEACRTGPRSARVLRIAEYPAEPPPMAGFQQRPTE